MANIRIPSLKALRALEASARHRSLTRAADELNVTTAAISQQLKTLEHDFGAKLVHRKDGEFWVDEIAQAGLADLREGFERLLLGVQKMREFGARRPLTVTVEPSFAVTWLVRRLPRFNEQHPDINIRLEATLRVVDFTREHDIDIGIRYGSGDYPGHRADKLLSEEVFPVCSPRLLEGDNPLRTVDDLRWHTLLYDDFETRDKSMPKWEEWLRAAGCEVDATSGPHFSHSSMVIEAAVLGHGVALIGRVMAGDYLATGQLVRPFGPEVTTPVDYAYYLVCLEGVAERRDIAAFRAWALKEAKLDRASTTAAKTSPTH
jgi:LysR family glycine cleavage system transcriptional activator